MSNFDLLTIGDIAVDVFIKIKEAEEDCNKDGDCKICLDFGSKIPYESQDICYATGNSSNVAVSASRLGLKTAILTNIGDDQDGQSCLAVLNKEGVFDNYVKINKNKPTSKHYILWYKDDRTILVKHENYKYEMLPLEEFFQINPSYVYLSSLGQGSEEYLDNILDYLNDNTNIKLIFSPGTFQIRLGYNNLSNIYKRTDIFICNFDEAQKILNKEDEPDVKKIIKELFSLGPKMVLITKGIDGSYAFDGKDIWHMQAFKEKIFESTGAGDSFAGAFIAAMSLGKSISQGLIWASINARSVIKEIGPQKGLLNKDQMEIEENKIDKSYLPIKI